MKNDTSLGSVITEGFSSSLAELYNPNAPKVYLIS